MQRKKNCHFCHFEFSKSASCCPHCGRPGLFPNVDAATDPPERAALQQRYETAKSNAKSRGVADKLLRFEELLNSSRAVISRPLGEVQRLVSSDSQLYATYYQLLEAGVRLPSGSKWDVLRAVADEAIFPGYKERIRFGALSLDYNGVVNYGYCHLILRDDMIRHRATAFEENSTMWMKKHQVRMAKADQLPQGYRSVWDDRGKLGVAKLAFSITEVTTIADFPAMLLSQNKSSEKDEFIEIHICGPLTVRSLERVIIVQGLSRAKRAIAAALKEELKAAGVSVGVP
jgi:hypothetical protein